MPTVQENPTFAEVPEPGTDGNYIFINEQQGLTVSGTVANPVFNGTPYRLSIFFSNASGLAESFFYTYCFPSWADVCTAANALKTMLPEKVNKETTAAALCANKGEFLRDN